MSFLRPLRAPLAALATLLLSKHWRLRPAALLSKHWQTPAATPTLLWAAWSFIVLSPLAWHWH